MAFFRFSASAVVFLDAAILFTTFLFLYPGWNFMGIVNCQRGSSSLEDMDTVGNDIPGMQGQDKNKCCKECQDDEGGCLPNCDACDNVVEGFTFKTDFKPSLVDESSAREIGGFLSDYNSPINPTHHSANHYSNYNSYASEMHADSESERYTTAEDDEDYKKAANVAYPYLRTRSPRRCCADCVDGDLYCLSSCEKYGCKPTSVCASAGPGAYSSFCQRECNNHSIMGFSALDMDFLPDRACRANCAKYVQRMCVKNRCKDHGCEVYDCAYRAVDVCG